MHNQEQFNFEEWYQDDPEDIWEHELYICGDDFTDVVINFKKMEISLVSDPSNILYLDRVKRGTEPPIENTDSDGSTVLIREVSSARLM